MEEINKMIEAQIPRIARDLQITMNEYVTKATAMIKSIRVTGAVDIDEKIKQIVEDELIKNCIVKDRIKTHQATIYVDKKEWENMMEGIRKR